MKTIHPKRHALGVCALTAILAACGGSQSQIETPPATQPLRVQTQQPHEKAKGVIKPIHYFTGSPDGADAQSGLVAITKRQCGLPCISAAFVGTTYSGGDANNNGTAYILSRRKQGPLTENVIYTFGGATNVDGSHPTAIVKELDVATPQMYVTTFNGGLYDTGAIVALTSNSSGVWKASTLYSFTFGGDGQNPSGGVVNDKGGKIYGTATSGGKYAVGTSWMLEIGGSGAKETILYNFQGGTDGANPYGDLTMDSSGALYGTTVNGGLAGYGTVFKLTPTTSGDYKESILYSFQGPPNDGAYPYGGITAGDSSKPFVAGGKIIGMTSSSGSHGGGVVYELTPATTGSSTYKETVLWNFGGTGDGITPKGDVTVNSAGVIFGTTSGGGTLGTSGNGFGTLFTLTPASGGTYKEKVYSFSGSNGANPYAGPTCNRAGKVYVTTTKGGANNVGSVVTFAKAVGAC